MDELIPKKCPAIERPDGPDRSIRPHRDARLKRLMTSPFTWEIDSVTPPKGFTQPKFAKYDGMTEAYTHLVQYKLVMSLFLLNEPSDDAFLCKSRDGVISARGFKLGLTSQDEQVYDDLARNKPNSMKDLMTRIEGRCQLIESKAKRGMGKSTSSKITSFSAAALVPTPVSMPKKQVNNIKESPRKGPKPSDFNVEKTVFTIPIYRIIDQVKDQPIFSFPNQNLSTENRKIKNPIVRCSYHNEQGHFTIACKPFKAYLEQLMAGGHLDNLIDHKKTKARAERAENRTEEEVQTIHVIHGLLHPEVGRLIRAELNDASSTK
ncbi:hypothetical protein RHMOL_Rhmol06G0003600 [Rhododendron molle]|uniref:Uncharacterized protein n=1 Tax=Rhododendron molle TaxID=49168 RepID=A0ACC0N8C0_RHOML|nr:hypothetical protein RHMOL_Rhmol06G0003600 [Rhododendron molle]